MNNWCTCTVADKVITNILALNQKSAVISILSRIIPNKENKTTIVNLFINLLFKHKIFNVG